MITVDQARQHFADAVECMQNAEIVPLNKALMRIVASDIVSEIDVPPADNSAMDGFAVNSADLKDITELPVSQRIQAGVNPSLLTRGTAARIFTGGELPSGADAVVIQENCDYSANETKVTINKPVQAAENVRPKGQDISSGETIIKKGTRISAVDLALIAAIGKSEVSVFSPIKVAVFSTGSELVEPGQPLQSGQIYNSNRTMLMAACEQLGYATIDCGIVEDTLEATKEALKKASEQADVIISSGGVSVGEEDHIKPAIEALGELEYWKVQMKPGKPVVLGKIAKTPIIGLPGNPVSSYIVFQLLALPLLQKLQGQTPSQLSSYPVIAGFDKKSVTREEFIRVRLNRINNQPTTVETFDNQSSGVLSSLSWADGLVRQYIDQAINKGDKVDFLPFYEGRL